MNADAKTTSEMAVPAALSNRLTHRAFDVANERIERGVDARAPFPSKPNHLATIQKLMCSIAIRFISLTPDEIDEEIERSVGEIGEYGRYDRCYVSLLPQTGPRQGETIQWRADGASPLPGEVEGLLTRRLSRLASQIGGRESPGVGSLAELCESIGREGVAWTPDDTDPDVLIPLSCEGLLIGFIGAECAQKAGSWQVDDLILLTTAGEVFAHALERKRVESEMNTLRKLEVVGHVAGSIAHEVNGSLAIILRFSQLLQAEDLSDPVRRDVQTVYQEAQRATKIFHDFLSCVSQGEKRISEIDVATLIERAIELKSHELETSNISVETTLPSKKLTVMVDALQMEKVLFNILTNAQQAMFAANGKGTIQVQAQKVDDRVRISLKDDGPGIPVEITDRILDPFFTTKTFEGGTGLGLSLSHGIVLDHEGSLWFESEPGKGATFHIDLPSTRIH